MLVQSIWTLRGQCNRRRSSSGASRPAGTSPCLVGRRRSNLSPSTPSRSGPARIRASQIEAHGRARSPRTGATHLTRLPMAVNAKALAAPMLVPRQLPPLAGIRASRPTRPSISVRSLEAVGNSSIPQAPQARIRHHHRRLETRPRGSRWTGISPPGSSFPSRRFPGDLSDVSVELQNIPQKQSGVRRVSQWSCGHLRRPHMARPQDPRGG